MKELIEGPRIRGRAYQLDDGLWTYFIILGEGQDERTIHCPQKYGWDKKENAVAALRAHVSESLADLEMVDNKTGEPFL